MIPEISVAIYNKLVLPCNTDLSACNSQILQQFSPCIYSNLTLRSVGSTIKKRAQLACADADSARVSLVCSTESIGRARVNNDRSAQSNNDRQNVITGPCRKYHVSRDGLLTNQHLKQAEAVE